jgi:hypothetical protein
VPEHNDLELLELLRTGTKQYELKHGSEDQVAERPTKNQLLESTCPAADSQAELTHPTSHRGLIQLLRPVETNAGRASVASFTSDASRGSVYADRGAAR